MERGVEVIVVDQMLHQTDWRYFFPGTRLRRRLGKKAIIYERNT
jgi:hypothetical protein